MIKAEREATKAVPSLIIVASVKDLRCAQKSCSKIDALGVDVFLHIANKIEHHQRGVPPRYCKH